MPDTTPRLNLPLLVAGQSQKHITLNEALMRFDALVQARVVSRTVTAQPTAPIDGDSYILPTGATGAQWAGFAAAGLVRFDSGLWEVVETPQGMLVYISDSQSFSVRGPSGWSDLETALKRFDNLSRLGVGTAADSYNRLALKSPSALLSADDAGSGDFSLALNKQADGNALQILLQKDYSTRAVLGLLGNNDLTLKVSNGAIWRDVFRINHVSGRMGLTTKPYAKPNVTLRKYVASQTWLSSSTPADNDWNSVAWSSELYMFCTVAASGLGNRVITSPDGVTWTARTSATDNQWLSVCWSPELSRFCALANSGTGNRIMTSSDGVNWTVRTTPSDIDWRSTVWAADIGLFVAVAASGTGQRVMTSGDGVTWTLRSSAADNDWQSVSFAPELKLLVAVASTGTGNRVMTSPDGLTWTARTSADDKAWRSVTWAADIGLFVAVAASGTGNRIMTSLDGLSWSSGASASDKAWTSVAWSPELGLFCAVAASGTGNRVMTSVSAHSYSYRS